MLLAGLEKLSLIDYPEQISAILFTQGCNFRCPFCHNPELIPLENKYPFSEKDLFLFLDKRHGLLDGVTITGGEPLLQHNLVSLIEKIKAKDFLVKLDTNGTNPVLLKKLIKTGLVDYWAMDIKGPLEKYAFITKVPVDLKAIQKSIQLIQTSGQIYEFRTTVLPALHDLADIEKIGQLLQGAQRFYLQNFRNFKTLDPTFSQESSFTHAELEQMQKILEKYIEKVGIRS
ncbi:anaerobic ribonucleoside-triphosphate reductase activating protein [Candidatus Peregrinibacteria bacterium CG08_land_8_20_14_0_20_41_10]|nr:MAG: anaerobic ribonucleoside-triphosphate reductase activating protein [Candidatus Peregrinibacteria bacterium CG08_land_8_20_14_0_20_41_10]